MDKKSDLVVKNNRLIEASYRLTLIEQQIILYAICESRNSGAGLSALLPVKIDAIDFAEKFNCDPKSVYDQLKTALKLLYDRTVKIRSKEEKTERLQITQTRWISAVKYIDGAGELNLIFAPEILPFIKDLDKEFTPYRLEQIGRMSSTHAVRLYELLRQNLQIGSRTLEIVDLKNMLQIENEYPDYFNFKRRVVDVAKKQINDFSDIKVDYTQQKSGRMVTSLKFKIEKNKEKEKKEKEKKEKRTPKLKIAEEEKKEEDKDALTDAELSAVGLSRAEYEDMHDYEREVAKIAIRNEIRARK